MLFCLIQISFGQHAQHQRFSYFYRYTSFLS
nr:MAG TPA: hypothetical protein [Caudoviricetes sp.]